MPHSKSFREKWKSCFLYIRYCTKIFLLMEYLACVTNKILFDAIYIRRAFFVIAYYSARMHVVTGVCRMEKIGLRMVFLIIINEIIICHGYDFIFCLYSYDILLLQNANDVFFSHWIISKHFLYKCNSNKYIINKTNKFYYSIKLSVSKLQKI